MKQYKSSPIKAYQASSGRINYLYINILAGAIFLSRSHGWPAPSRYSVPENARHKNKKARSDAGFFVLLLLRAG
ncbi:hypothetical protein [Rahnella sp. AA]|uniref:hypothetical protein n=1 Tax=Rahnella sp. AA TaxID=2057180 RepID=UPI0012FF45B1|nr:hypothetical protein [Rahnella sp. AA]